MKLIFKMYVQNHYFCTRLLSALGCCFWVFVVSFVPNSGFRPKATLLSLSVFCNLCHYFLWMFEAIPVFSHQSESGVSLALGVSRMGIRGETEDISCFCQIPLKSCLCISTNHFTSLTVACLCQETVRPMQHQKKHVYRLAWESKLCKHIMSKTEMIFSIQVCLSEGT